MSVPHLNLINFEHPASRNSKYILTSPKSLKACQKAGIKPVELLYRSLDDVKREVGRKDAHSTYQELEKERQQKLETCRRIRNELLMQGYPHFRTSNSLRNHHGNKCSPTPMAGIRKSPEASEAEKQDNFEIRKQATLALKPSPRQNGKHKRSQSLPLRPDTPKGATSDLKSESSPGSFEMPPIDKKQDHHNSFEDINYNHSKAPIIMRPLSSRRRKHLERKKIIECKKIFDQIRAQYKDPEYCLLKYRQIIDNSIERELREQEVRKVQRRMEEGLEMWQDRVLMLQWLDSERAKEQVTQNLESKIDKLRRQHKNKEIVHAINLNKVKEEDDIRSEVLRRELMKKEKKIQALQEEKERVIFESKSRALAVSELKDQIRNIMTPETFDQKMSKCGREKKVIRVLHPPQVSCYHASISHQPWMIIKISFQESSYDNCSIS
uniref:Myosin-3 n=2 Tax=Lygus hesperus TaxID=30085 RepID=A0A0A9WDS4_LYGHE